MLAENERLLSQIIEIEAEKKHSETKANDLSKTIEKLTSQISSANSQVDMLQRHNASLEQKHKDARDALQHYRESVSRQREQDLARHDDAVAHYQQQARELNFTISTLKENESKVAREYSQLAGEHKKITADFESMKQAVVNAELQVREQGRTNIELDSLNKQLSEGIEKAEKQIKTLTNRLSESENFNKKLTSEQAGLKGKVVTLRAVLDKFVESNQRTNKS